MHAPAIPLFVDASPPEQESLAHRFRAGAALCGGLVSVLGVAVLVGWALHDPTLFSLSPESIAMKANTAVAFVLAGASLLLQNARRSASLRGPARALAVATFLLGFTALLQDLTGVQLGIDELLFRDQDLAVTAFAGRMATGASLGLMFAGASLALLTKRRPMELASQALALAAGAIGTVVLAGYAYGAAPLLSLASGEKTPVALNTAAGLVLLSLGVVLACAAAGRPALLVSRSAGGMLIRRLLPIVLLAPFVINFLMHAGIRTGRYGEPYALALATLAMMMFLALVVSVTARLLDRIDHDRQRSYDSMQVSEAQYRLLFENMTSGFAHCEMQWDGARPVNFVYLEVNDAFTQQTGLAREAVLGHRATEVIAGIEATGLIEAYGQVARTGKPLLFEQHLPGLGRWFAISVFQTKPGFFAAIFHDITDSKRTEIEIRNLNESLERRTATLTNTNKELESFSYAVAHDLRGPLRSIDGFSKALLEDWSERLDAQAKDYLERMRRAAQRLARLIDELLRLSRITRSVLHREPVDLTALARGIVAELRGGEPSRSVELDIEEGMSASGDAQLVGIIFQNLLENAWKFTSRHPTAHISVGRTTKDGQPAFFVRDDGAGFDMAYSDKLFGAFQRLHGNDEFPGTGIGLATVQRAVSRQGGRIWGQGEVDKGAQFTFTLPEGTEPHHDHVEADLAGGRQPR